MKVICNRAGCCDYCSGCQGDGPHEPDLIVHDDSRTPLRLCTTVYRCHDAQAEVRCIPVAQQEEE